MQLTLQLDIPALKEPINYKHKILLTGSCFTEHISDRLSQHKFRALSNPHGILFNPLSVAGSLDSYTERRSYNNDELFQLNELWNSWDHHTRFSHVEQHVALEQINRSQQQAARAVREADWIMITLGSSFQYFLKESGRPVANNHRAPAQWFEKRLLTIEQITAALTASMENILKANPTVRFMFTISPVRHIRDGVVDNNRSKARLIEAVHRICEQFAQAHYFPAYELVIDILRDYRFYDIDFVHPNYLATEIVWEHFLRSCIDPATTAIMREVHDISIAKAHRARFPETAAHRKFKKTYLEKVEALATSCPFLDLSEERAFFST